MQHRRHFP